MLLHFSRRLIYSTTSIDVPASELLTPSKSCLVCRRDARCNLTPLVPLSTVALAGGLHGSAYSRKN